MNWVLTSVVLPGRKNWRMMRGGWSLNVRHLVNVLFALVVPLGATLFYLGIRGMHGDERQQLLE